MSYRSRLYNHRNAQSPEGAKKKPFFSKLHENNDVKDKKAFFQAKLSVNSPDDQHEQEADRMASSIVNNKSSKKAEHPKRVGSIQRLATSAEDEKLGTNDARMERDKEDKLKPVQRNTASSEKEKEKAVQKKDEPKKEEEKMKGIQKMGNDHEKKEEKKVQKKDEPKKDEEKLKGIQKMGNDHEKKEEKKVQKKDEPKKDEEKMKGIQKMGNDHEKKEEDKTGAAPVQKKPDGGGRTSQQLGSKIENSAGKGNALPTKTMKEMNGSFGTDFSNVTIHNDNEAADMSEALNAQAFTHGRDIYFNKGKFSPEDASGKSLLAHELTHVVQQNGTTQPEDAIQRRLFVSGANAHDPQEFLDTVGDAAGLQLQNTFANPRVNIIGNTATPVVSQTGRNILTQIINHPTQHAEIFVGTHQPGVSVGSFPDAGQTVQDVDLDDIENINASVPGQGTAKAYHEMFENFTAHAVPGMGPFDVSHHAANEAESNILEEEGIAGRRLNQATIRTPITDAQATAMGFPTGPGISYRTSRQVFTNYFLDKIEKLTDTPAGPDIEIVRAVQVAKAQIHQSTIDGFASGSNALPPAGNVLLVTTLAVLNGNPNSTLLIEGFTDDTGTNAINIRQSTGRANAAAGFFTANGIDESRIAAVGRGETNFVAANDTEAGRAQNRRVVLTVHN
jgi:outer membrane protein OmpA-like peptidoglycan-associated protein